MAPTPHIHLWAPGMYGFKGGIQVYSSFVRRGLLTAFPEMRLQTFLKQDRDLPADRGIHEQVHVTGRWPARLQTPAFVSQLIGRALAGRPDLILSTHLNFAPAAHALKRWQGIPYWVVAHGLEAWEIPQPRRRAALAAADAILPVSPYTQTRLQQALGLAEDHFRCLPNTFDPSRFQPGPKPDYLLSRYSLCPEQPVLLTVNRLVASEPFRPYDQVLAALPALRQRFPNLHYVIAGKGDDRPRLEQSIHDLGLEDAVTLAGFVPDAELPDHYNLADMFVLPSKYEGFGIVFLEALACGRPAVGSLQDGGRDALLGGELGALVNPDALSDLVDTVTQILQKTYPNPLLYDPAGLRQRTLAAFGFESFTHTLRQYLDDFYAPDSH